MFLGGANSAPLVLSAPNSVREVFDYRDPTHWIFGLTTLGLVGLTQMMFMGGLAFNIGDLFGMRRIWGGLEGDRGEIRVGAFFGGGILWVVMIIVGLGKYQAPIEVLMVLGLCYLCIVPLIS